MTALLVELKTRARLRLNAARRADAADAGLRLRDCLTLAARDAGFSHWEHARRVLGGEAAPGDDMGSFWHAPGCHALLNHWYASHADARASLAAHPGAVLLPYRRQFVVAGDAYVRELGMDPADPAWEQGGRDLAQAYGGGAWLALALRRLKAPPATFASR
jgi:hypothetical protein